MSGSPVGGPVAVMGCMFPRVVCARVTGARHLRESQVCQDAVREAQDGRAVAVAVADGHGTSARGDVGASLAVEVAVEHLMTFAANLQSSGIADMAAVQAYAEHPMRIQLTREWTERVRRHAGDEQVDLHLYGTTLLFALATPTYLLIGQIGDGDILLVDAKGTVGRPIPPDPRHFAEETSSLCQSQAWTAIATRVAVRPATESLLLLSTDGYSKSYATDAVFERVGPDYLGMLRDDVPGVQSQLPEILEAVTTGGSGDDIAVGMLYWSPPGEAAESAERERTDA